MLPAPENVSPNAPKHPDDQTVLRMVLAGNSECNDGRAIDKVIAE